MGSRIAIAELLDYRGERLVDPFAHIGKTVIVIGRAARCARHVRRLIESTPTRAAAGIEAVVIVTDERTAAARLYDAYCPNFPITTNPSVQDSRRFPLASHIYVIDERAILEYVHRRRLPPLDASANSTTLTDGDDGMMTWLR